MITHKIKTISKYYRAFGLDGLKFLFKQKHQGLISVNPKYKHKIWLRGNTSDIDTFIQVIFDQSYNIQFDFTPLLILDLGANIGLASLFFKNKFPNAKIIALEPELNNFNLLLKNTELYTDIECYNLAIWNKTTSLSVKNIGLDNWGFIVEESVKSPTQSVTTTTIDKLIEKHAIDYIDIIKIDIEGSEKELFSSDCSNWLSKTRVIIIELHDRIKPDTSKTFFEALSHYDCSFSSCGENVVCYINHHDI